MATHNARCYRAAPHAPPSTPPAPSPILPPVRILSATLQHFRNLEPAELEFSPSVNLLLGANGEGKTNLLEALNWFALGRSHMGAKPEEMIAFGQDALHVSLQVEEESGARVACEFGLDRRGGRRLKVDGEPLKQRADLVGRLVTVVFNPDTIGLVRGAPQLRRQFADQGMAELDFSTTGQFGYRLGFSLSATRKGVPYR